MEGTTDMPPQLDYRDTLPAVPETEGPTDESPSENAAGDQIKPINQDDACKNVVMLYEQLKKLNEASPGRNNFRFSQQMIDPEDKALIWISKWLDFSADYGFGYGLSNGGIGVSFKDDSKLLMVSNEINVHYIAADGVATSMTVNTYPAELKKKMKLRLEFKKYMVSYLKTTGANIETDVPLSSLPYLYKWYRDTNAVFMHLSNGTVQVNFRDHTKMILSSLTASVTLLDKEKSWRTVRFSTIEEHGCPMSIYENLRYIFETLQIPDTFIS